MMTEISITDLPTRIGQVENDGTGCIVFICKDGI